MRHRHENSTVGTELSRMKAGQNVRVSAIQGGWHMRQRLNQMGIHIGDHLHVKQAGAFHGPMLIETDGSQIALGCGMARKILVEIVADKGILLDG